MTPALRSPRFWLITLAAVLVAGTTFSLGQWQLRRAAQKELLHATIESKNKLVALDTQSLVAIENIANEVHRPAVLQGTWQTAQTIYLDNRSMSGRTGFWVLTPLALQGSQKVILVQRGWVPRDFTNRARLPQVATPAGLVTVQGRIAPPPSKLYEFKGADLGPIRQNLNLDAFRLETGLPLLEVSLLQTGEPSEGLLRDWAAPNLGVDKHYGYAFQWFALAALVLILYVWFQLILPFRNALRPSSRTSLRVQDRD
ncbi:Cytochrome oxidase assembly protein ShyY1 [Polaromonas sp. OV174]|uniref:SURF1 family protein n=1 Tax=Polaromonas sp. OV174 TaxID=1855300 RepID=UPI0008E09F12|nr:SURF1 family protein [Polaromonas sp. OV174]SFC51400.1 Cytochrome oxidase assembly protein ShyY1 [Polaromonas sp. OV174]